MAITAYVNFPGNCREAVGFYAGAFGVKQSTMMTFGEMPNPDFPLPEAAKNLIMHTYLQISGGEIMFSDAFPGMELIAGNNISLTVVSKDKDDIVNWFNRLKEGGTVQMELQETFWSKCYGSLRDKYGIAWQFSLDSGEMPA